MTDFQLFEILQDIDNEKIENAYASGRKSIIPFLKIASLVACFALITTVSLNLSENDSVKQEMLAEEQEKIKEDANFYDENTAREESVCSLPKKEAAADKSPTNDVIVKEESANFGAADTAESIQSEENAAALDFYGGTYINEAGKTVVIITEDTVGNREIICNYIGREEDGIIFRKGEFSLNYLTRLQEAISEKMSNNELPLVVSSSIAEEINRIEVLVTSSDDNVMKSIKSLDTKGGAVIFKKIDSQ